MLRVSILPLLLLILCFTGCGKGAETARLQLAQMNIPFTEMDFLASARQGNSAAVGLFIDAGVDMDARDGVGQTALMTATLANQLETARVLLARKADPKAKDNHGGTALMTASWNGNREFVDALLAAGADVNARADNGMTALMFAAWENHPEIVKSLLEKGADPEIEDGNGWTALRRAEFKGHTEVTSILTEARSRDRM